MRHGVPDPLAAVCRVRIEPIVVIIAHELDAGSAAVDGRVVYLQQARPARELAGDVGHVHAVDDGLHDRLAYRPPLVPPQLLDELGAADLHELKALEVRRLGEQNVGHVIGLVAGVGERNDERKQGHLLGDLAGVPRRDRRVGPVGEPDLRARGRGPVLRRGSQKQPGQMRRPERRRPRGVGDQGHQRAIGVANTGLPLPRLP